MRRATREKRDSACRACAQPRKQRPRVIISQISPIRKWFTQNALEILFFACFLGRKTPHSKASARITPESFVYFFAFAHIDLSEEGSNAYRFSAAVLLLFGRPFPRFAPGCRNRAAWQSPCGFDAFLLYRCGREKAVQGTAKDGWKNEILCRRSARGSCSADT